MPASASASVMSNGSSTPETPGDDEIETKNDHARGGAGRASTSTSSAAAPASTSVDGGPGRISYRDHLTAVSKLTYPIVLSEVFQNTLPVVDIAFVGQLGKDDLGAAALATVWFNLWNSAMIGFMTAIDTLLSQSHGAGELRGFAAWTGTSLVLVTAATAAVSGLVALCGPAMRLFGQDPTLSEEAGRFSMRLIPGLFPYYLFKVLTKYLQTQNRLAPGVWIGLLANAMNALFNLGLIFAAGLGVAGAPWATTLTRLLEFVLICLYIFVQRNALKETLPVFSREYLRRETLRPFWKLSVSGALSIAAEAWSFEITTILAGLLGTVALDAHIITMTIAAFIFLSFPFAVGIAASIKVGQLIGDQRPTDARRSSHTSFVLSASIQAVLAVILWPCSNLLGTLFSSDQEVSNLTAELIPISCVFMMGDAVQATTGGVLRGLGRQRLVLWLNLLAFWFLGVPIGAALTFGAQLGVAGLWWGMVIGLWIVAIIGIWCLQRVDWGDEAGEALKRLSTIASTRKTTAQDELSTV